ncbi:MAG: HD domain-containing protein [Caldithrix sp.]|nr:MAG: HD domain-containing protein [Caldithrix sp.]
MQIFKQNSLLNKIGKIADQEKAEVYAVGGVVRDKLLGRDCKDIDFVIVGDGPSFAKAVAKKLQTKQPTIYQKFGTALVVYQDYNLEFVGARKESYRSNSRKPTVTPADLSTDLARRDFTINALAIGLNKNNFGEIIDHFNGQLDIRERIIRTPLDPVITFEDDPLRILRAIRFATQLDFTIEPETKTGIEKTFKRLDIISPERITEEFLKILLAPKPSIGFFLMEETGVLNVVFPEFVALKGIEQIEGHHHKDVFRHTLKVVDNVAAVSQDINLRYTALVHDIAKPRTKEFVKGKGWTFHNHEEVGARMLPGIGRRLRLPNEMTQYAQKLTRLHLRPISLTLEEVTDSAYRRLLVQAGEHLEDLLCLCRADITSQNPKRVQKHLANFDFVVNRLQEVEGKDQMRAFQSPVRGEEIMRVCNLKPGPQIGKLKKMIEEAILEGDIPNDYDAAYQYLLSIKDIISS